MSENKITFPVKLASNNPQSFGIVDATEVSGHRSVDTISELYAISDSILSILKDGSDAIGQEWFVVSEDCKYRLDNWESRKSSSGWTKLPKQELINTKQSVSEKDQPNGYAGLDSNGKLPIEKTYGDTATIVEVETYELLPVAGLSGVIYYVSNTSAQYKWSGSAYIDITGGADNAKKNETSIFDCSNGTSTKYYASLSAAVNVVPPVYRTSNRIISYLSTENATTTAVNYQYHGIDSTTWTDLTKWERIPNQSDLAAIRSDLTSSNLFNKATITENAYIRGYDGTIATGQTGWWCSDFIQVEGYTQYSINNAFECAFYDTNKNYISGNSDNNFNWTFTTPVNAAYFRFSQYQRNPNEAILNVGSEVLPYVPYDKILIKQGIIPQLLEEQLPDIINGDKLAEESVSIEKLDSTIIVTSSNLFNKATITENAYIRGYDGTITTGQTGWWCSDFIPVQAGQQYNGSAFRDYAFYDSNKQYLSGQEYHSLPITAPQNAAYIRFSQYLVPTDNFIFNEGSEALPFVPYRVLNPNLLPSSDEQIGVTLPQRIYAVVGDTIQIFFRGIIKAVNPYNYDICVTASAGRMYPRYYELTASSAGTVNFNIKLKNSNDEIAGSASTVIDVKQAVAQPSSEKNVLFIGDSLTAAGVYTQEAYRRLTGNGGTPEGKGFGNIAFVGRKPYGGIHAEGNSGWSWSDYLTEADRQYAECFTLTVNAVETKPQFGAVYRDTNNNEFIMWWDYSNTKLKFSVPLVSSLAQSGTLTKVSGVGDDTITWTSAVKSSINPFWNDDTGSLDFPMYVNKWCGGSIDVVYTLLTWNAQWANRIDFSSFINYAKTLYRHIHANYPSVKIKMMGIQVPDTRQGMGALGIPQENGYTDMYGLIVTALNMNKAYEDMCNEPEFSTYVEFVNVSSQVDSEYNMPFDERDVNIRNSNYKDKVGTNDVHPNTSGYLQIADVVYRNFICNSCQ